MSSDTTSGIETGEVIAIVAILVAVLCVPLGIWLQRRFGERRGRLLLRAEVTPLLDSSLSDASSLAVMYRDFEVPSPHLLQYRIANVGPRDITSSHFDRGRPLAFVITECTFYGVVKNTRPHATTVHGAIGSNGVELCIGPTLIRRDADHWLINILVSGKAKFGYVSYLIDVDVKAYDAGLTLDWRDEWRRATNAVSRRLFRPLQRP